MNHPFPEQLPLLRRIYADRFTAVRFLIPFERMPDDEDVITVYRGSYGHASYITDARRELAALDCDFYLVLHDDVLLNPKITERTFTSVFPLGPNEAFISDVGPPELDLGGWVWYFGMLPKLLYPKSQLFGSGIERHTLARYLPSPELLAQAFRDAGVTPATRVRLNADYMPDVVAKPARAIFQGLAGPMRAPEDPEQEALDKRALGIARDLQDAILDFEAIYRPETIDRAANIIELPIPLVTSAYATDFYILPRSGLETFAHYIGVAAAANLFVEIMAPTLLYASCERVRMAADFGLDSGGLRGPRNLAWFSDIRAFAIHPFKLSRVADHEDAFIEQLDAVRDGSPEAVAAIAAKYFGSTAALFHQGFHPPEPWGVWAAQCEVVAMIQMAEPGPVTLAVAAPISANVPRMTLTIDPAGGELRTVEFGLPETHREVRLDRVVPDAHGVARIKLSTDRTVSPARNVPGSDDARELGIGIVRIAVA